MWKRKRRTDEDFAEEISAHIALEAERLIEQGLPPEDALAAARRAFGSVTRTRERFYESRRAIWLHQFAQDLRYALRGLRHSRSFVASTVLTLAVGMSLVTVVFAILNAYVLRPFAVHDPYSLYSVAWRAQEAGGSTFRWKDYEQFLERHDLFDGVIAESVRRVSSTDRQLSIGFVSGNYFETLGARVVLGRSLTRADAPSPGGEPVALLSHQTWTRFFDADPTVLGRELEMNGTKMLVVGVMASEFVGLDDLPRDAWVPLTMAAVLGGGDLFGTKQPRSLRVTARLRHDVTPAQAQGSLNIEPFETKIVGQVDPVRATLTRHATPGRPSREGIAVLSPVIAAFVLVLIAACANASNVMLARANARHREIGVRLSIGASRGRIVRQLLTEGLLIAVLAALAGLAFAGLLLRLGMFLFVALLPPTIALRVRFVPLDFDYRVFAFACGVACVVTILFALLPALQATRLTLTDALRGQPSGGVRSSTLRNLLVTGQVTVSLVLLIVAATLVRNGTAIQATNLGLDTREVVSVRQYRDDRALVERAHRELVSDPRIAQVVVTSRNPLFGEPPGFLLRGPSGPVRGTFSFVSPEYFSMLGIPLVHGRGFSEEEARLESAITIVSASAASALWPGEDPIGKTVRLEIEPRGKRLAVAEVVHELRKLGDESRPAIVATVVGVAGNAINGFVYTGPDPAHFYLPTSASGSRADALLVRGRTLSTTAESMKSMLLRAHADPTTFDVMPLDEMVTLQMFPLRAASLVGTLLSVIALALSISGLYGVLTYTFGQRTQEIGIRMALGASTAAVRRLVFVHSLRLASGGTALGLVVGYGVMKLLSTVIRLENVSVIDPGAFVISLVMISGAVALASYGPARRAVRIDPSSMLRADA